jgi:hypothetical protein
VLAESKNWQILVVGERERRGWRDGGTSLVHVCPLSLEVWWLDLLNNACCVLPVGVVFLVLVACVCYSCEQPESTTSLALRNLQLF